MVFGDTGNHWRFPFFRKSLRINKTAPLKCEKWGQFWFPKLWLILRQPQDIGASAFGWSRMASGQTKNERMNRLGERFGAAKMRP